MREAREQLIAALVACDYERSDAALHVDALARAAVAAYLRRVDQRLFGPKGEANWYHVTNPAGEREWVLRGTRVKSILEEETKR